MAERSEYVTALDAIPDEACISERRRHLHELRRKCTSEEMYEMEKSREHWTEVRKLPNVGIPVFQFTIRWRIFVQLIDRENTPCILIMHEMAGLKLR